MKTIINSIQLLIQCISQLGIKNGLRYFHAYLKTLRNPEFLLQWADSCEREARRLEFFNNSEDEEIIATHCRNWAKMLRESYSQFYGNKK